MGVFTTLLRFSGDASSAVQAMDQVTAKMGGVATGFSAAGKSIEQVGTGMVRAGAGIGFIAAPATAALGGIIASGLDMEKVMHQIEAVTGESATALGGLEKEVLRVGKDLPLSTKEAGELAYSLATLGFNSKEVKEQLDGVGRLAVANKDKLGDLSQAGSLVGSVIRGFGMDTKDTNEVLDILTTITDKSAAEITDLTYTMKYVAPSAGAAHQSLAEMASAIGIMANVGIKGEMSGVALRNTLTRLLAPTKEARKVMNALGIQVSDSSGQMLPFTEIIEQFRETMSGATDEEQAFIAKTIAGEGGLAGFMALVNSSPKDWDAMKDAMYRAADAEGAVINKRVDVMLKGSTGNIEQFKGSVETLAVTLFKTLAPSVEKVTGALFKLVNWFLELPPETQGFIAKFIAGFAILFGVLAGVLIPLGMVAMAVGALIPVFGAVAAAIGGVITFFTGAGAGAAGLGAILTVLTGPVGLVILAIVALIAVGVLIWKNWDKIVDVGKNLWRFLGDLAGKVGGLMRKVQDFVPPLKLAIALFDWFTGRKQFNIAELFDILSDFIVPLKLFKSIWGWLMDNKVIKFDMNAIQSLLNLPHLVWDTFVKALDWFKFIPDLLWNMFAKLLEWRKFIDDLKWTLFLKLLDWAGFIVKLAWSGFLKLLDWASFVGNLVWSGFVKLLGWSSYIGNLIWGGFVGLLSWGSYISNLAWSGFLKLLEWASFVSSLVWSGFATVLSWASFIGNLVWSGVATILDWANFVGSLVWSGFATVLDWTSFIGSLVWSGFATVLSWADFIGDLVWSGVATILDWASFVGSFVWSGFVAVLDWANFVLSTISSWWEFVGQPFVDWITGFAKLEWPDWGNIFFGWLKGSGPPPAPTPTPTAPPPGTNPPGMPSPGMPAPAPKPSRPSAPSMAIVETAFEGMFGYIASGFSDDVPEPAWSSWLDAGGSGKINPFVEWLKGVGKAWAKGGMFFGPTVGLVGEAGPEAIMPLSQFFGVMRQLRDVVSGLRSADWGGMMAQALPMGSMSITRELAGLGVGAGGATYQLTANYREHQSETSIRDDLAAMEMAARMRAGR